MQCPDRVTEKMKSIKVRNTSTFSYVILLSYISFRVIITQWISTWFQSQHALHLWIFRIYAYFHHQLGGKGEHSEETYMIQLVWSHC